MREKLRSFPVFFLLIFCCNKLVALSSATVPESDILHKGETPGEKKKETFDGFSDIFGIDDFKTSNDKPGDFFALYCGREVFNYTFTWTGVVEKVKKMFHNKAQAVFNREGWSHFESIDSFFYRYFHRFFKSPGRFFLNVLTFIMFSKRTFLGMDTLAEYSFFLKKKIFFTVRVGWDYNDFAFKYKEDFDDVVFKPSSSGAYDFKGMTEQKAVEFCGGDTDSFISEKKKADLKYCNELASVQAKNKKLEDKKKEIFTADGHEVFVFTSLYKYFLDFGLSYYSNPRKPAESFVFRFLIKLNAFYNVTGIDYVIASSPGIIRHFTVDDVINKYISSPTLGCKICLCFGYKNLEFEISIAPFKNKYKTKDECSGMFYSESLQKRLPVSIAIRNRFIGL